MTTWKSSTKKVRMYVCVEVYRLRHTHNIINIPTHVRMCIDMYENTYVHTYVHHDTHHTVLICTYICTYVHMYVYPV